MLYFHTLKMTSGNNTFVLANCNSHLVRYEYHHHRKSEVLLGSAYGKYGDERSLGLKIHLVPNQTAVATGSQAICLGLVSVCVHKKQNPTRTIKRRSSEHYSILYISGHYYGRGLRCAGHSIPNSKTSVNSSNQIEHVVGGAMGQELESGYRLEPK